MKIPYIDIHTHRLVNSDEIISVQSLFLQDIDFTNAIDLPFSAAIHPWHSDKFEVVQIKQMLENLALQEKLIAIGECGLDKGYPVNYEQQEKVFELHVDFAEALHKPLIIHAVKSWNELTRIFNRVKVPVVLHGYSEGVQLTRQLIDQGCFFSLGKSVLNPSPRFLETIQIIPPTSLFLETDESDISIEQIYQEISNILELPLNLLKIQITENFNSLIGGSR